ncbi:MAG: AraC family transcriptional regulator ligand-binding domain-containing protein [Halioglobus sp.]
MPQGVYVASDLAGLLRRFLAQEGIQAADINAQLAAYPANSRMPMDEWWDLLEKIQLIRNEPALGVKIGACVQPEDSGVMGYMVMYCKTAGEALLHFQRYQQLIHNFSLMDIEARPESLVISWDLEQGVSTQLSDEVFLSGLMTFIQRVTGRADLVPREIHFIHTVPFEHSHYERLLGCPVRFGCERVAVEIQLSALNIPINSHNPYLLSLLEKQAEALVDTGFHDELLNELQKILVEAISQGEATLAHIARRLNVSTRTLHRRLEERGLNFQKILQKTRRQLAEHYLSDSSLSLNEVAFLLGYSEQSAFNRAFRGWFNMPPKRYRVIRGQSKNPDG